MEKESLKVHRIKKGLTQKEMAEAIGVSVGTWSSWENYKSYPNAKQIRIIEDVLGASYDSIFFDFNHGLTV